MPKAHPVELQSERQQPQQANPPSLRASPLSTPDPSSRLYIPRTYQGHKLDAQARASTVRRHTPQIARTHRLPGCVRARHALASPAARASQGERVCFRSESYNPRLQSAQQQSRRANPSFQAHGGRTLRGRGRAIWVQARVHATHHARAASSRSRRRGEDGRARHERGSQHGYASKHGLLVALDVSCTVGNDRFNM